MNDQLKTQVMVNVAGVLCTLLLICLVVWTVVRVQRLTFIVQELQRVGLVIEEDRGRLGLVEYRVDSLESVMTNKVVTRRNFIWRKN